MHYSDRKFRATEKGRVTLIIMGKLYPPTKGEGGHITSSFSGDPGHWCRRDKFVSTILLESVGGILPDLHGYIIGTSQRAD